MGMYDRAISRPEDGVKSDRSVVSRGRALTCFVLALASLVLVDVTQASWIETVGMGSRATGLGNAFIGVADDLSANYYNPAGLTQLIGGRDMDTMLSVNVTSIRLRYQEPVFNSSSNLVPGQTVHMDDEFPEWTPTPFTPFGFEIGDRIYVVPLPIQVPFAGAAQFSSNFGDARYSAAELGLIFINWSPSVAIRATNWLSIGLGFDLQIANDIWFKTVIGDGAVGRASCRLLFGQPENALCGIASTKNGVDDGYTLITPDQELPTGLSPVNDVNLDFQTPGFRVGLMFFPDEQLRIGLTYRSSMTPDLEGRIQSVFEPGVEENPVFKLLGFAGDVERYREKLRLPQEAGIGASYRVTDQWMFAIDGVWVNWADRQNDVVRVGGDGLSQTAITSGYKRLVIRRKNWKDVYSLRTGIEYRPIEPLRLDVGFWWDPSPTPDSLWDFSSDPGERYVGSGAIGYYGLFDGTLDVSAHIQWITIQERDIQVGESSNLGGAQELVLPDPNGLADPIYGPNDNFSVRSDGDIVTFGVTLVIHM